MKSILLSLFIFGFSAKADLTPLVTSANELQGSAVADTAPANGQVLTWNSTTESWGPVTPSAGSGTVTSIAQTVPSFLTISGSPITTTGTLAIGLSTQTSNTVFAGPSLGGAATPTFRSLVSSDIPSLSSTYANTTLSNISGVLLSADLVPSANNLRAVGSTSSAFANVYSYIINQPNAGAALSMTMANQTNNGVAGGDFSITASRYTGSLSFTNERGGNVLIRSGGASTSGVPMGSITLASAVHDLQNASGAINITTAFTQVENNKGRLTLDARSTDLIAWPQQAATQDLRFFAVSSANFVALKAPSPITTSVTWTLPDADGTSSQVLTTNGSGILSWSTPAGGANTALSNLASVAINTDLIFDTGSDATLKTKNAAGAATRGLSLVSGSVTSGTDGSGGVTVQSGDTITGATGPINIGSGFPNTSGSSGDVNIYSSGLGAGGGGSSGGVNIQSGNLAAAGNSGDVNIATGTITSGTRGVIQLVDASLASASVGYVWTLTNTSTGAGEWDASGGGGIPSFFIFSNSFAQFYPGTGPSLLVDSLQSGQVVFGSSDIDDDTNSSAQVTLQTGTITSATSVGSSQSMAIITGDAYGSGSTGGLNINSGFSDASSSGSVNINSGDAGGGVSGSVQLSSGGASGSFNSGNATIQTGPSVNGNTGNIVLQINSPSGSGVRGTIQPNGHIVAQGDPPAVSSCGTGPSVAGNDVAGRITVGTGGIATSCTLTFLQAWAIAPVCSVGNETTTLFAKASPTTTTLVISSATPFAASDKISYHCVGF